VSAPFSVACTPRFAHDPIKFAPHCDG